jgi:hypothetical protein
MIVWAPVVQTAIGALAAIGGGAAVSWITWQRERQSIANAIAGEIRAFVAILKWRNASELLRKGYEFPYEGGDFPVFAAYVAKIGLLPSDIAGDVTEFYGYAAGIFQDFKTLNANRLNDLQKRKLQDSLANNIDGIIPKAETLILKLQKEAARSWME